MIPQEAESKPFLEYRHQYLHKTIFSLVPQSHSIVNNVFNLCRLKRPKERFREWHCSCNSATATRLQLAPALHEQALNSFVERVKGSRGRLTRFYCPDAWFISRLVDRLTFHQDGRNQQEQAPARPSIRSLWRNDDAIF